MEKVNLSAVDRFKALPRIAALTLVDEERNRQDAKWGDQSGNHPFEWMSILGEEYGELCEAVNETFFQNGDKPERGGLDKIRKEAVQVAAVAVAIIEAIEKQEARTNESA
jgi:NTP pyrophosphatase (non-canonical NTP hydrolase)